MAVGDTAKLLASLDLEDKLTPKTKTAIGSVTKLESSFDKIGASAKRGLGTAVSNMQRLAVVAAAGIGAAIGTGLGDLATLESAVTSVDGAIKSLGMTGQVTGQQVAGWANEIEASIGAAFDDKDITKATASLIRYGKVAPANLRPAMVVMTDLAAKTGSVESAATILAKALADPANAAGKLTRAGVVLTKQQQEQIKAFVKSGDTVKAQAVLLDALTTTTKGAAAATQGPYQRALSVLKDVSEDARKALAEGFLPVIEKVSTRLSTALADPKVMASIRDFGKGLASGLDSLLGMVDRIPWSTIGESLRLAGTGAKAVLDAFLGLPAWVQTAVLTGWGLNKLTGGALGDIVSELGKGLIKGVLSMNAAVVNINAAAVRGGGFPGGAPLAAGGGASLLATLGTVVGAGAMLGAVQALAQQAFAATNPAGAYGDQHGLTNLLFPTMPNVPGTIQRLIDWITGNEPKGKPPAPAAPDPRRHDDAYLKALSERGYMGGYGSRTPGQVASSWIAKMASGGVKLDKGTALEQARTLADTFTRSTAPNVSSMKNSISNLQRTEDAFRRSGDTVTANRLAAELQRIQTKLDTINVSVRGIQPVVNSQTGFNTGGAYQGSTTRGGSGGGPTYNPKPGGTPDVNDQTGFVTSSIKVSTSSRDVTTATIVRSRYGPTPAQAGAA